MNTQPAFDCLSSPTRRAVFAHLRGGAMAVGEIADQLPVSRPAVSQHLQKLQHAGLISRRIVGTRNYYQIRPQGLIELQNWLHQFWDLALDNFQQEVKNHVEGKAGDGTDRKNKSAGV